MKLDLHAALDKKWEDGTRPKDLYALFISKQPKTFLDAIVLGLQSKQKRVQSGSAELASLLSEENPGLLYPHVDLFLANLSAKEPILRWEAACTVGNLASVDTRKRIPEHVNELIALLGHKSVVLQGHAAKALGKIARENPKLAPRILKSLFAHADDFPGTRVGYLIEASELFADSAELAPQMRAFIEPYTESELRPVATKARRVMNKLRARA